MDMTATDGITPARRREIILRNLGDSIAHDWDDDTDPDDRYLLLEQSTKDYGLWITTHETARDAGMYVVGQEYPEDWDPQYLVDLQTGEWSTPVLSCRWDRGDLVTTYGRCDACGYVYQGPGETCCEATLPRTAAGEVIDPEVIVRRIVDRLSGVEWDGDAIQDVGNILTDAGYVLESSDRYFDPTCIFCQTGEDPDHDH